MFLGGWSHFDQSDVVVMVTPYHPLPLVAGLQ